MQLLFFLSCTGIALALWVMSSLVVFQHSCRTPAMQCCCSPGPCLAALLPWLACFAMACMAFSYSDVLLGWHMYFSDFTKTKMQDDFLLPPPPPPHNLPAPPPLNPRRPCPMLQITDVCLHKSFCEKHQAACSDHLDTQLAWVHLVSNFRVTNSGVSQGKTAK